MPSEPVRRPRRAGVVPLVLASLLTSCTLPSGFSGADRGAIQTEMQAWADAVVAGDVEAIVATYEPTAVLLPPDGPPIAGTEAITAHYGAMPDVVRARVHLVELNGHGPLAYALGSMAFEVRVPEDDEPLLVYGRFVELWRRNGGAWKRARGMFHELDPEHAGALDRALFDDATGADEAAAPDEPFGGDVPEPDAP